ncbi:MAG: capsular polysaccharide biosynthesis protein [Pseudotabrizicola sp.]|uniref:capsular polysaccharide biosynthesis protein n=1 Tax=Pseudotabrizicola sp. TaxID=2939647 RepID=UPI002722185F|nr:capsular polysaccharide biosynthesis protein [Pseudotabrizicola sp.]MDO8882821.1 capsular polysaccharide biosynthesis protein [Pseudotabrizicola sp.]MDP2080430.1 capsular polysaccharide biosynthesis protein [Pseudotabrizicola sp.]MDZ7573726.1 capsular polysaccharide biosynthesis protein [Pseudotabrizicola sp.]
MAPQPDDRPKAAGKIPRRLCYYTAGFLRDRHLRRILTLSGHELALGKPGPDDGVVVWGRSPYAHRGEAVAARRDVPLIRVEDAFLRSVRPGRLGGGGLGLMIDPVGVHFDSSAPSRLEQILANEHLDDSNILMRARDGIERIRSLNLSKYNMHDASLALPDPGYVLVVDQTRGDASIRFGGARAQSFSQMLGEAMDAHPQARIVLKVHPETALGLRAGHFSAADVSDRVTLLADPVSPRALLDGAIAVYTVSSQLGFEAILAGHRPHVYGQPFYAGWGLSHDATPLPRRGRNLTRVQLFAAAMILAPVWYDPCRDRLCSFEEAVDQLEAEVRAFREDRFGHIAVGMRLWKRGRLQAVFGVEKPLIFRNAPREAKGRGILVWAGKETDGMALPGVPLRRVEDGFLRSRGLGADLVPPLSLVTDDLGIYYDPSRESRLERLILSPPPPGGIARATRLRERLVALGLTKYNLSGARPDLPRGHRILVPGQVEDDASILKGGGEVRTNLALLQAARAAHPGAMVIYKPHPDVEAGLRAGALSTSDLNGLADVVASQAEAVALIDACDEVWTMTSLLGFEALLRGKPVTCLGAPFYAGWGLTHDLGPVPTRRMRGLDGGLLPRPTLDHLVHAALIAYPRYYDPASRRPCPVEVAVDRLATGVLPHPGLGNRFLAKLQGRFATYARFWRR